MCTRHSCNNVDQWLNPLARFSDRKELAVDQRFKVRGEGSVIKRLLWGPPYRDGPLCLIQDSGIFNSAN